MSESIYEHHTAISGKKALPFTLTKNTGMTASVCNWHDNIEILYITSGDGFVRYGGDILKLNTGDILIVNPNIVHQIHSDTSVTFYCLIADNNFFYDNSIDIRQYLFNPHINDHTALKLFEKIISEYYNFENTFPSLSIAKTRSAVLELMIHLCMHHTTTRTDQCQKKTKTDDYIKASIEYINTNCADNISLDTLAAYLNISKSHLSRIFKGYTGQTVHAFINTVRCKKAEQCILDGMTIAHAASVCGYETLSYFSRTYKKIMGKSPSKTNK